MSNKVWKSSELRCVYCRRAIKGKEKAQNSNTSSETRTEEGCVFISRFSGKILQYISYTIWTGFTGTLGSKFLNSQHVHYKANSTKSTNNHGFMVQLLTCLINKYTLYCIYTACVARSDIVVLGLCVCAASLTGRNTF